MNKPYRYFFCIFVKSNSMKRNFVLLLFILFFASAKAQLPTVGDCLGAIPICSTYYDEPDPYVWEGTGNYPDEIFRDVDDGCMIEELNGMWYTFTSLNDGLLRFTITPHDSLTDYDWNVFDITYGRCSELKTNPKKYLISSNTFGAFDTTPEESLTGANTSISGGSGNCNGPGIFNGPAWNDDIPVFENHIYLIYISNWNNSAFGYSIDFSESTADIWDRTPPKLKTLFDTVECGQNQLKILFSENILCNRITSDFFKLRNSTTEFAILSATSTTCENGGTYSREFILELDKALHADSYILNYTDTLCDICGNKTPFDSLEFQIDTIKIKSIETEDVLCGGETTGSIFATANYKNSKLTYSINGIDFLENNGVFNNLSAGNYIISIKNEYGCTTNEQNIEILEADTLKSSFIKTDVFPCFNDGNGKIELSAIGGTPNFKYSIDNGTTYSINSTFENLTPNFYQLIVKDANDCKFVFDEIQINEPEEVLIYLVDIQNVLCKGEHSAFIEINNFSSEYSILWSNGENTQKIENLVIGNYAVTVTDKNNCKDTKSLTITEPEKLILESKTENIACFNESTGFAEVTISGGVPEYSYLWSNGNTTSFLQNIIFGEYKITATDANNCTISETLEITQPNELKMNLTALWATTTITPDGSIFIDIQGGTPFYDILINAENLRPPYDIYALYSDFYTVTVSDENGCQVSDTINIKAYNLASEIEVPNIFTPNGDGFNDLFLLKAYGLKSFSCIIVNRWGRQVYAWDNPNEGWDGKIKSTPAADGVYFYVINAVGLDGEHYVLKGSFHLLH